MKRLGHEVNQRGAVAVLVALILVVLIGAAGIVLDLGRLFVAKTELQNAADACALAAARELNTPSKSLAVLTRAENAGITVGNRHRVDFQDSAVEFVRDQDVTFSSTLNGGYVTKAAAPADVRYVRCSREVSGFLPWFMQVLGAGSKSVGATAVASLQGGVTSCPLPLGMCRVEQVPPPACTVPGETPDRFGLCKGQWYSGELGNKGAITGNFNWIDFTPHGGGANEVEDLIVGRICEIGQDQALYHAEPGGMQSLKDGWNSRFGLYKHGGGQFDVESAPPDFTGYAYGPTNWPQGRQAYADYLTRQSTYQPYPGDSVTGLDVKNFKASSSAEHARGTADRRIVSMPVVVCSTWGSGHQALAQGWACALMVRPMPGPTEQLQLEYLGEAGVQGVPCASHGLSGGPGGTGPRVPTLVQ